MTSSTREIGRKFYRRLDDTQPLSEGALERANVDRVNRLLGDFKDEVEDHLVPMVEAVLTGSWSWKFSSIDIQNYSIGIKLPKPYQTQSEIDDFHQVHTPKSEKIVITATWIKPGNYHTVGNKFELSISRSGNIFLRFGGEEESWSHIDDDWISVGLDQLKEQIAQALHNYLEHGRIEPDLEDIS